VAWVGMVVNYSQEGTVGEALAKTLGGKHPCALCKAIAKGKQSEKKPEFPVAGKKFEFSYSATVFVFSAPTHFWRAAEVAVGADSLSHAPPVPPPRIVLGSWCSGWHRPFALRPQLCARRALSPPPARLRRTG